MYHTHTYVQQVQCIYYLHVSVMENVWFVHDSDCECRSKQSFGVICQVFVISNAYYFGWY